MFRTEQKNTSSLSPQRKQFNSAFVIICTHNDELSIYVHVSGVKEKHKNKYVENIIKLHILFIIKRGMENLQEKLSFRTTRCELKGFFFRPYFDYEFLLYL